MESLTLAAMAVAALWLPVDEQGWTVLTPSADSRLIYVSSTDGDDETGAFYAPGAPEVGQEPFEPAGAVRPFKTIAAAKAAARPEHPDWILLKRGEVWHEEIGGIPSGRSADEPLVIASYGPGTERPLLKVSEKGAITLRIIERKNILPHDIAVVGLSFYGYKHDPNSPDYIGTESRSPSIWFAGRRLLIEDCRLEFLGVLPYGDGIVIRRNLVLSNYSNHGHSQGSYSHRGSVLLEENIYDHNGWWQQGRGNKKVGGGATIFNHNTYFTDCHDVVFRGNMFLRASSIGNKWTANSGPGSAYNLVMDNNLYVEGEIGLSVGGNKAGPLRFRNVRVTNNVFLDIGRARPTLRNLGWYMGIVDWDGGLVARNLFLHQVSDEVNNVHAISLGSSTSKGRYHGKNVHCRNVTVRDNIVHGLKTGGYCLIVGQGALLENILFENNAFQLPGLTSKLVRTVLDMDGVTFRGNTYYSDAEPGAWFRVGSNNVGFEEWVKRTGETGARAKKVDYPDAGRCIETYMAHLGKEASFEAFVAEVRKQSKANWRAEFTADAVNGWIRAGFGVDRLDVP